MTKDHVSVDVLIVGGGMAGIMAARTLENNGYSVYVIDKSRSVGGRMATRRVGPGVADHGAQFFTVRDPEFQTMVDEWVEEGLVYVWSHGFSDGSLYQPEPEGGNPRYVVKGGLNTLPKYLAQDLKNVVLSTRIVTATCDDRGWILQDDNGDLFLGDTLLLTTPVPQALEILDEGATVLVREDQALLSSLQYHPCLTGIFWVEGKVTLPQPGAIQRKNSNISWVADNRQKGISPDATIITVQANDQYSAQMWSAPDERVLNALRTSIQMFMADDAEIKESQLKRWRYSRPVDVYEGRFMHANNDPVLMFAGDAFGGPRVEGAALSGIEAGKALSKILK